MTAESKQHSFCYEHDVLILENTGGMWLGAFFPGSNAPSMASS